MINSLVLILSEQAGYYNVESVLGRANWLDHMHCKGRKCDKASLRSTIVLLSATCASLSMSNSTTKCASESTGDYNSCIIIILSIEVCLLTCMVSELFNHGRRLRDLALKNIPL